MAMIRSGQNVINNGCRYIFVNSEHLNGTWMNIKMMKSKGNKLQFENACSQHKNRNLKKHLDPRRNTLEKTLFPET